MTANAANAAAATVLAAREAAATAAMTASTEALHRLVDALAASATAICFRNIAREAIACGREHSGDGPVASRPLAAGEVGSAAEAKAAQGNNVMHTSAWWSMLQGSKGQQWRVRSDCSMVMFIKDAPFDGKNIVGHLPPGSRCTQAALPDVFRQKHSAGTTEMLVMAIEQPKAGWVTVAMRGAENFGFLEIDDDVDREDRTKEGNGLQWPGKALQCVGRMVSQDSSDSPASGFPQFSWLPFGLDGEIVPVATQHSLDDMLKVATATHVDIKDAQAAARDRPKRTADLAFGSGVPDQAQGSQPSKTLRGLMQREPAPRLQPDLPSVFPPTPPSQALCPNM
jgi:hypothetical protein